jgi:hypothetical protein
MGALTVEHVLPRNPGPEWESDIEADPSISDDCTYRLGNLCLLTKINKDAGRKSFTEKTKYFQDSKILTTKEIAEVEVWDRQAIEHRQAALAKLGAQVWHFQ